MFIDDPNLYKEVDQQDMHGEMVNLPNQLVEAWELGSSLSLPAADGVDRVLIAGMGGSAIGADLLAGVVAPTCNVPIMVHRDYGLPGWASGQNTLVITSSHSGNTEETLSAYEAAKARNCRMLVISTGGELTNRAEKDGVPYWNFTHAGQPRAGIGYSFGLLLSVFARLSLIEDPQPSLNAAIAEMRTQAAELVQSSPAVQNPAKRYAGQLMDRSFTVFGAEFLVPVARRWKAQINEIAKAWASYEEIPEANHNALAGLEAPESLTNISFAMFLVSNQYGERNALRMELTRKAYMLEGVSTDFYQAKGSDRMSQLWTTLQFGDYMSYYLSMWYKSDPTPVEALVRFKEQMSAN